MREAVPEIAPENQESDEAIPSGRAPKRAHHTGASSRRQAPHTWIVASTHPHKEPLAVDNLIRQGYTVYCPMIRKTRRHARRLEQVLRPLFPGYVFVGLDLAREPWRPIRSTYGVRTVVHFGDKLGRLDPAFIEALRAREKEGAVALPDQNFSPGDPVRLIGGPFDGLVGEILSVDARGRLMVLMSLLQQSVRVRVEAGHALAVRV